MNKLFDTWSVEAKIYDREPIGPLMNKRVAGISQTLLPFDFKQRTIGAGQIEL